MYEQIQRPISVNNSLYNPEPKGVFSFASTDGTFTNSATFGKKFYNPNNPYNPIYHSTTWSIRLPKKINSAWVGFTTTVMFSTTNNANFTNEIATALGCPKNLSLGNLVFFNITPNNIPFTGNRTISNQVSYTLDLINYLTDGTLSPITATDSNSLNVSKVPVLFPDNRLVEYLPPEGYYDDSFSFNTFWNTGSGNQWFGSDTAGFMTTGVYLTQIIENNLEVSYLNVDFQIVWNGVVKDSLNSIPRGSGVIYMY
jgi:hypothetical protein